MSLALPFIGPTRTLWTLIGQEYNDQINKLPVCWLLSFDNCIDFFIIWKLFTSCDYVLASECTNTMNNWWEGGNEKSHIPPPSPHLLRTLLNWLKAENLNEFVIIDGVRQYLRWRIPLDWSSLNAHKRPIECRINFDKCINLKILYAWLYITAMQYYISEK